MGGFAKVIFHENKDKKNPRNPPTLLPQTPIAANQNHPLQPKTMLFFCILSKWGEWGLESMENYLLFLILTGEVISDPY